MKRLQLNYYPFPELNGEEEMDSALLYPDVILEEEEEFTFIQPQPQPQLIFDLENNIVTTVTRNKIEKRQQEQELLNLRKRKFSSQELELDPLALDIQIKELNENENEKKPKNPKLIPELVVLDNDDDDESDDKNDTFQEQLVINNDLINREQIKYLENQIQTAAAQVLITKQWQKPPLKLKTLIFLALKNEDRGLSPIDICNFLSKHFPFFRPDEQSLYSKIVNLLVTNLLYKKDKKTNLWSLNESYKSTCNYELELSKWDNNKIKCIQNTMEYPVLEHMKRGLIGVGRDSEKFFQNYQPENGYMRPPLTECTLIGLAVVNSNKGFLLTSQIFDFISHFFPFYSQNDNNWKLTFNYILENETEYFTRIVISKDGNIYVVWGLSKVFFKNYKNNFGTRDIQNVDLWMKNHELIETVLKGELKLEYEGLDFEFDVNTENDISDKENQGDDEDDDDDVTIIAVNPNPKNSNQSIIINIQ